MWFIKSKKLNQLVLADTLGKAVTQSDERLLLSLGVPKKKVLQRWVYCVVLLLLLSPAAYGWAEDCWYYAQWSIFLISVGTVVLIGLAIHREYTVRCRYTLIPDDYRYLLHLQKKLSNYGLTRYEGIVSIWVERANLLVARMLSEPEAKGAQKREVVEAWAPISALIIQLKRLLK